MDLDNPALQSLAPECIALLFLVSQFATLCDTMIIYYNILSLYFYQPTFITHLLCAQHGAVSHCTSYLSLTNNLEKGYLYLVDVDSKLRALSIPEVPCMHECLRTSSLKIWKGGDGIQPGESK